MLVFRAQVFCCENFKKPSCDNSTKNWSTIRNIRVKLFFLMLSFVFQEVHCITNNVLLVNLMKLFNLSLLEHHLQLCTKCLQSLCSAQQCFFDKSVLLQFESQMFNSNKHCIEIHEFPNLCFKLSLSNFINYI